MLMVGNQLFYLIHKITVRYISQGCVEEIISNYSNLTQGDNSCGVWPSISPKGVKDNTTPFPSLVKGTHSSSSTSKLDIEATSCKTEVTDKDDLDDVLWGGVEGGVKMEMETMDDSFTKELLELQLEETDTKSHDKRVAYIEDGLAEKIINYLKKLYKQLEICSDVLETFPPPHQHTPYKVYMIGLAVLILCVTTVLQRVLSTAYAQN